MKPRRITFIWFIWCLIALGVINRTPLHSDLTFFLPQTPTLVDRILLQQMREGPVSRLILIALSGASKEDRARASRSLVKALEKDTLFLRVSNGEDSKLLKLLEGKVYPYRFHLVDQGPLTPYSSEALHGALTARWEDLYSPLAPLTQRWLESDPQGLWTQLLQPMMGHQGPLREGGLWVSKDHQRSLILAETEASGFDIDAQQRAEERILNVFEGLHLPTSLHLTLGGPGAISVATHQGITQEAKRLSLINSALVMGLLLLVYRSWRYLGLGLIPLVTGLLTGAMVTAIGFGQLHGITLGFGSTLLGVAADYPNHLFTHLEREESPRQTMKRLWPTLRLGVLTNIAGFGAMLFSGFKGLSQLAVFAGSGLLAAALTTRFILPPWIHSPPHMSFLSKSNGRSSGIEGHPLKGLSFLPWFIVITLLGLFFYRNGVLFNDDIAALNPVPTQNLHIDASLQEDFKSPELGKLLLVTGADQEALLRNAEAIEPTLTELKTSGIIQQYDLVTHILPSHQKQHQRLSELPSHKDLIAHMKKAQEGLPFRQGLFDPFLHDAEAAKALGLIGPEIWAETPMATKIDTAIIHLEDSWALVIPLHGVTDDQALKNALDARHLDHVQYVDLKLRTTEWMTQYRQEALRLLGIGLLAITLILWGGLGRLTTALRVLMPVLAAGISTALMMALLFGGLNLYHLVSLLLVLGLSLDQALFFNRPSRDTDEYRRTRLSLMVCSLSSILAFGTLACAHVAILDSIGLTVALGAFLAVSFAALMANERPSAVPTVR